MIAPAIVQAFVHAVDSPDDSDLVPATLYLPRLEYRDVDPSIVLGYLAKVGARAATRVAKLGHDADPRAQVDAINVVLYDEEGFAGNQQRYDDPSNSFLNDVVARRTGIPISLAVVYLDIARQSGVPMEGVNFPGHFLVRWRPPAGHHGPDLIVDPFHAGALLSEGDCRELLRKHLGDEASYNRRLLARADKRDILVRMLINLKRLYVSMRSFPQARDAVELLLALDPLSLEELRDRGLLSYHLQQFPAALRDLEAYLLAVSRSGGVSADEESRDEYRQVWDHVKTLRRRVAGMN